MHAFSRHLYVNADYVTFRNHFSWASMLESMFKPYDCFGSWKPWSKD